MGVYFIDIQIVDKGVVFEKIRKAANGAAVGHGGCGRDEGITQDGFDEPLQPTIGKADIGIYQHDMAARMFETPVD